MNLTQAWSSLLMNFEGSLWPHVITYLAALAPIMLVFILAGMFRDLWFRYVRAKNFFSIKNVVLEIKLPKDTFKSPLAMETILHSLHNTADTSSYSQIWDGKTRPWYSLEIISVGGQVKFMIWIEDARKGNLMSALYSQYPGIEIYEKEDYSRSVHFDPDTMKMWAADFEFVKSDAYPIKTYVDYGLDKDPKEEFKVDPLIPVLEFLGSAKPNQQIWIQYIIRAHKKKRKKGSLFDTTDVWKDEAKKEINKLLNRDAKSKISGEMDEHGKIKKDEKSGRVVPVAISEGERDLAKAIERKLNKLAFDVGIRTLFISPKDTFEAPVAIGGLISSLKQFNSESLNGLKQNGNTYLAQFSGVPWEDYKNWRRNRQSRWALAAYKRRSFFYPPFEGKWVVMNTEELATVYHFPGSTAATPTLERVPSKKSEAPMNLPI